MNRLNWLCVVQDCILLWHLTWFCYHPVIKSEVKINSLCCRVCAGHHISYTCIAYKTASSHRFFFFVQDWWIQTGSASAPPHTPYASCHVLLPCSVSGWHWAEASQYILFLHMPQAQSNPGECIINYTPKDFPASCSPASFKWKWPFQSPPHSWNITWHGRISIWTAVCEGSGSG